MEYRSGEVMAASQVPMRRVSRPCRRWRSLKTGLIRIRIWSPPACPESEGAVPSLHYSTTPPLLGRGVSEGYAWGCGILRFGVPPSVSH